MLHSRGVRTQKVELEIDFYTCQRCGCEEMGKVKDILRTSDGYFHLISQEPRGWCYVADGVVCLACRFLPPKA
jgi:hypothetical protein